VRAASFWSLALAGASALALASAGAAQAQEMDDGVETSEEVVVTGSYLARAVRDTPTPVSVIGTDELEAQGILGADYLFKNLPMANGQRSTPDNTGSPYQLGMANINLRGLGVASTLTLINGRRQVVSPVPLDDGSPFVDINSIPFIMMERLEVLQDGGAALYGSDAVAGVANFIMRDSFEGFEVRASYQTTTEDSQEDLQIGILGGLSGPNWDFVAGFEHLDRGELGTQDRPYSANKIVSALGFPGAFQPAGSPLPIIDPNCAAGGGIPTPFVAGTSLGLCSHNLSPAFTTGLILPEERQVGYATFNYRFDADTRFYAELGYANNEVWAQTFPAYPNLAFPVVPANNPGNLVANGGFGVPVTFYGRPLNLRNSTPDVQYRASEMIRAVGGFEGNVTDAWRYDASYAFAWQNYTAWGIRDTLVDRFIAALNGVGGPNNNQFFNPFGSSLTNPALANDPAVIDDFSGEAWRDYDSTMHSAEVIFNGPLWDMPAGPVRSAFGAQARYETLEFSSDIDQQTGNFVFLFSGPDFDVSRTSYAAFGEVGIPLSSNAEVTVQARYEHYDGGIGGSFNPKIALRWEPTDGLVLRANVGTSFRAPSLSQLSSISTINAAIVDPLNPSLIPYFNQILTLPPGSLEPETAVNAGAGVFWSPTPALEFSLDYWRYDYSDLIVKQNAQAIVNANPNDPRIIRQGGSPTGLIQQVQVTFVNQNAVLADGIDFSGTYRGELGPGDFNVTLRGTYLNQYTTTINGVERDVSGNRNYSNFARSLPKTRASLIGTYTIGPHTFGATVNHISAYDDFINPSNPVQSYELAAFTTWDVNYGLELEAIGAELSLGILNVSNIYPPQSRVVSGDLQGFDRFVHDPRGRMAFVRVAKHF